MYKIKTTNGIENSIAVMFPAEALENLGISVGDEIDVTETENALILRSTKETGKSREIADATKKVFSGWDKVFVELAKSADEK